uniref:COMM domain-containing protein 3 n=1 Tax=Lygus hesperus TaxID=30085 RepID=A0A0A9YJ46_LYGHE
MKTLMKLSTEICTGLKRAVSSLSDDKLDLILQNLSLRVEDHSSTTSALEDENGADVLKQAYAALFSLIVEGVRWKEDDFKIKDILKECKLSDSRIAKILNTLGKQRIPLQISLKQSNANFPHIFDVTWKMNFIFKSSYSDIDGKALYFINFLVGKQKKNTDGSFGFGAETVTVVCTVNQLQSLVAALKAATRKLEAIADAAK